MLLWRPRSPGARGGLPLGAKRVARCNQTGDKSPHSKTLQRLLAPCMDAKRLMCGSSVRVERPGYSFTMLNQSRFSPLSLRKTKSSFRPSMSMTDEPASLSER